MARMSLDTELKKVVGIGVRGHVDYFNCDTTTWWKVVNKQDIWYVLNNTPNKYNNRPNAANILWVRNL